MAKFGENIQEFKSTLTLNRVPVTSVGDRWLIMNDRNSIDVKQGSSTVQTWLLMDGRNHSFTSSIVHFSGNLYSVMDHNVLIRWSIEDSSLRNPEKVEFQEAVFDIISVPDSEPIVVFKSGQLAVIDTHDFPNTRPVSMKIRDQLDWADAAKTETGIRIFYKTHCEKTNIVTLYYFTIDKERQRSSANCSYSIRPENVTFKCCALNHLDVSFLSLWSDGSIRYFSKKEDKLLFSIEDVDRDTTLLAMTCLDSRHIAIVKGKLFSQECSLEIWDFKKPLLKGRKIFKTHHHLQNLQISVLDNSILIHFHSKILAIPFTIDSSFLASLNTYKAEAYKEHSWSDDAELIAMPVTEDTTEMEVCLSGDSFESSVDEAVENLLKQDPSDLMFLPEYKIVQLLKLAINCKKKETLEMKAHKNVSKKLFTLLNIIFGTSFNDALLAKNMKSLSADDTLVIMELLLSFLKETVNMPQEVNKPPDLLIVNWMFVLLSAKTETLFRKEDRTKIVFQELRKTLSQKIKEYEDLERVESIFSLLQKRNILPEEYSAEKYCIDILDV